METNHGSEVQISRSLIDRCEASDNLLIHRRIEIPAEFLESLDLSQKQEESEKRFTNFSKAKAQNEPQLSDILS